MSEWAILRRRGYAIVAGSAIGAMCVLASAATGVAEPGTDATSTAEASTPLDSGAVKPGTAGYWIYADPDTGEVGALPRGGSLSAAISADPAYSTSHEGLVEVPAPGGGVMVDLQGRFRSAAVARMKPDGGVVPDCVQPGMPVPEK